jgi:hypothetical protein
MLVCLLVAVPYLSWMVCLFEAGGGCILPYACHLSLYSKGRRKGKGGRKEEDGGRFVWCVPWLVGGCLCLCVYVCVCVLV